MEAVHTCAGIMLLLIRSTASVLIGFWPLVSGIAKELSLSNAQEIIIKKKIGKD